MMRQPRLLSNGLRTQRELRKLDLRSSRCIYSCPPASRAFYLDELLCITRIGVPAWKSMRRAIVGLKSLASTRRL